MKIIRFNAFDKFENMKLNILYLQVHNEMDPFPPDVCGDYQCSVQKHTPSKEKEESIQRNQNQKGEEDKTELALTGSHQHDPGLSKTSVEQIKEQVLKE